MRKRYIRESMKGNTVCTIYQPNLSEEGSEILFMNYATISGKGLKPSVDNYDKECSFIIPEDMNLEDIYCKLNMDIPHALSVSNVIVIKKMNDENPFGKAYYVDTIGFEELTDFFPYKHLLHVRDALIYVMQDDALYCRPSENEDLRPLKLNIKDIKKGDAFISQGAVQFAAYDACRNLDEIDEPWIVYDAANNCFFEEDIAMVLPENENADWIPDELRDSFIFDDELCIDEHLCECVNGYMWATDFLVKKLKEYIEPFFSKEALEAMGDISFYGEWNHLLGKISVLGFYSFYDVSGKETRHFSEVPLTQKERAALQVLMNNYCIENYKLPCLELVNNYRKESGLDLLPAPCKYFQDSCFE